MTKNNIPDFIGELDAEQIEEAIATEFAEKLSKALGETQIKVNIGTIEI